MQKNCEINIHDQWSEHLSSRLAFINNSCWDIDVTSCPKLGLHNKGNRIFVALHWSEF